MSLILSELKIVAEFDETLKFTSSVEYVILPFPPPNINSPFPYAAHNISSVLNPLSIKAVKFIYVRLGIKEYRF